MQILIHAIGWSLLSGVLWFLLATALSFYLRFYGHWEDHEVRICGEYFLILTWVISSIIIIGIGCLRV